MLRGKINGVCLQRVGQLISKAKKRLNGKSHQGRVLLESYCTGDINDIVDILVLYHLRERTLEGLTKELEKVASTLSRIAHDELSFGYTEEGHLGLYLTVTGVTMESRELAAA
jgi:hypothetical protein